jgi:hypothetical protein
MGAKSNKKPYKEQTDLEKIRSQWNKLSGLRSREEWSAAVVRAATAAEIAANFAIRREFEARSQFDAEFVDSLLIWANGIEGKINRLLIPLCKGIQPKAEELKRLKSNAEQINKDRNAVVHRGEFRRESQSRDVVTHAETFVKGLIRLYEPSFKLKKKKH